MRLVFISDTHNRLSELSVPDGDVLIHTGDMTMTGTPGEISAFNKDLRALPHFEKVIIAGNHDWLFQKKNQLARTLLSESVHYLQDESAVIKGLRFYGSPWQPEFCDWAFNLPRGERLSEKWSLIPDDTDILLTHGPPYGWLDSVPRYPELGRYGDDRDLRVGHEKVGCKDLLDRVLKVKPKIHAFGHIHCDAGEAFFEGIHFVNSSIGYHVENKPVVVDL